jgi:hypothetical protein
MADDQLPQGYSRTESGLVVPTASVERQKRRLAPGTAKRMRNFLRHMRGEDIGIVFMCSLCNQPIDVGAYALHCPCSVRAE